MANCKFSGIYDGDYHRERHCALAIFFDDKFTRLPDIMSPLITNRGFMSMLPAVDLLHPFKS